MPSLYAVNYDMDKFCKSLYKEVCCDEIKVAWESTCLPFLWDCPFPALFTTNLSYSGAKEPGTPKYKSCVLTILCLSIPVKACLTCWSHLTKRGGKDRGRMKQWNNKMKWNEMKRNKTKWNKTKWNETKRNEMKRNEMKWNEMKWNEMKWNEMKWKRQGKIGTLGRLPSVFFNKHLMEENRHMSVSILFFSSLVKQ